MKVTLTRRTFNIFEQPVLLFLQHKYQTQSHYTDTSTSTSTINKSHLVHFFILHFPKEVAAYQTWIHGTQSDLDPTRSIFASETGRAATKFQIQARNIHFQVH